MDLLGVGRGSQMVLPIEDHSERSGKVDNRVLWLGKLMGDNPVVDCLGWLWTFMVEAHSHM